MSFLNLKAVRRVVFAGALFFLLTRAGLAQVDGGFGPGFAGQPPVGRAHGMTPQINKVLTRMLAVYQEARSYKDDARVSVRQGSGRVAQTTEMPSSVVFRRPNLLRVVGGAQSIVSDGQTLQVVLDRLRQYTSGPSPESLHMEHVRFGAPGGGLDEGYPEVLEFLIGSDVYERWAARVAKISIDAEQAEVDGHACHVIRYNTVYKASIAMYIDAARSLLLRCDIDATATMQAPGSPSGPTDQSEKQTVEVRYDLFPVEINAETPEALFAVVAPKDMTLVSSFQTQPYSLSGDDGAPEMEAPAVEPEALNGAQAAEPGLEWVGRALPKIDGVDLLGEPFEPETLNGKTALVFFWSPDSGPDSLVAIHMVQRVTRKFTHDPGVAFLSVSTKADQPNVVKNLLRAKQATYPTVLDNHGLTSQAFGLQGLPMYFVVSPDGVVRHVLYGGDPEMEDSLVEKIKQTHASGSQSRRTH